MTFIWSISADVTSLSLSAFGELFEAFNNVPVTFLGRCRQLKLLVGDAGSEDPPSSQVNIFAAIMSSIRATVLDTLSIIAPLPHEPYVRHLMRAFQGGAFPTLRRIEGGKTASFSAQESKDRRAA